jgi:hypothetical protein
LDTFRVFLINHRYMSSSNKYNSRNSRTNVSSRRKEVQWKDANPLKVGASTRKLPMALPVRDISVMGHAVDRRNNDTPISVAEECTSARTDTARSSYSMTVDIDPWAQYEGHSRPTGALYGLDMEAGDGQSLDELDLEAESFSTRLPSPAQGSTRQHQQQLHLHQPRMSSSDDGGSNNVIFRRVSPREREMVENSSLNRVDAARRSRKGPGGQQSQQLEQKEVAANNARWLRGAAVLNLFFALFVLCYGATEMHSARVSVTVAASSASSSSSTASSGRRRLMFQQHFASNSDSSGGLRRRQLHEQQQGGEVEVAHRKPKPKPKPRPGGGGGSSGGGSGTEDEEEKNEETEEEEEKGNKEKEEKEGEEEGEEEEREKEGADSGGETDRKRVPRDDSGRTDRDGSGGGDSDSGSESDSSSSSSTDSSAYRKVYDFYASTIAVHLCLYSLYLYCASAVFKKEGGFRTSLGSGVFFASSCVWLGVAAIIIVIQIWTYALGYMASVYAAETVLNVIDLLYFSAASLLAGRELASIMGNDSTVALSLATPSSHHNFGSGGAGIIAMSESQHNLPSEVVNKPGTANATVATAPGVMPSAPSAAAVVGEKDNDVQQPPQRPPRKVKSSAGGALKPYHNGSGGQSRV